jgi:polyketide biosynthesis acyl carrier protein
VDKQAIFALITKHAGEVIPRLETHDFQPSDSLRALGANSIDRSEIVMMTLEVMELDIPLSETIRAENIGELAALLHEKSVGLQA